MEGLHGRRLREGGAAASAECAGDVLALSAIRRSPLRPCECGEGRRSEPWSGGWRGTVAARPIGCGLDAPERRCALDFLLGAPWMCLPFLQGVLDEVPTPLRSDSNNLENSLNLIIPLSSFSGRQIWMEDSQGDHSLSREGQSLTGTLLPVNEGPVLLPARERRRCVMQPWTGRRVVLVAFTVRSWNLEGPGSLRSSGLGYPRALFVELFLAMRFVFGGCQFAVPTVRLDLTQESNQLLLRRLCVQNLLRPYPYAPTEPRPAVERNPSPRRQKS